MPLLFLEVKVNNITAYVPAYKYSTDEWGIRSSSPVIYMKETVEHELSSCYVKWQDYQELLDKYNQIPENGYE